MKLLLLVTFLSIVSPILGQGFVFGKPKKEGPIRTRLGLLQPPGGKNPIATGHGGQGSSPYTAGGGINQNQGVPCAGYGTCCCLERQYCTSRPSPNTGGGVIDIRIQTPETGGGGHVEQCPQDYGRDEVYCCVGGTDPYPPVEPRPDPIPNPQCADYQQCCCVQKHLCTGTHKSPNTGGGIIDIRLKPSKNVQTRTGNQCYGNEVRCCAEEYVVDPYPPITTERPQHINVHALNEPCGTRGPYLEEIRTSNYGQGGIHQASFGEFPWLVVLLTEDDHFLGAGVILDQWTVLTADHKVFELDYTNQRIKVRAGEWDAAHEPTPRRYVESDVSYISYNPDSNVRLLGLKDTDLTNNTAIVHLKTKLPLRRTNYIGSACLPNQGAKFDGSTCWVAGWGVDKFVGGSYQIIPKKVDLKVLPTYDCGSRLRQTKLGHDFYFDGNSFICAGGDPQKDACTGDGGAPLVCGSDYKFYVAGIVAWGIGCGKTGIPGVYTNVASFANFINRERRRGPKPYYGPRRQNNRPPY